MPSRGRCIRVFRLRTCRREDARPRNGSAPWGGIGGRAAGLSGRCAARHSAEGEAVRYARSRRIGRAAMAFGALLVGLAFTTSVAGALVATADVSVVIASSP